MGNQARKQLKSARKSLGLTQAEVAKKAGIYVNHYALIERGEANPSNETLKAILKVLKLKYLDIESL